MGLYRCLALKFLSYFIKPIFILVIYNVHHLNTFVFVFLDDPYSYTVFQDADFENFAATIAIEEGTMSLADCVDRFYNVSNAYAARYQKESTNSGHCWLYSAYPGYLPINISCYSTSPSQLLIIYKEANPGK